MQDKVDHVAFPTHEHGRTQDSVITDLGRPVGSLHHHAQAECKVNRSGT